MQIHRALLAQEYLGSWSWDIDADQVGCSDHLRETFGWPKHEPPPPCAKHAQLNTAKCSSAHTKAVDRCLVNGSLYRFELHGYRKDGQPMICEVHGADERNATGKITPLYGVTIDRTREPVTLRRREDFANKLRTTLESLHEGLTTYDPDWRFTYLNPKAERMILRTRRAVLGKVLWSEFPETAGSRFETMYRKPVATCEPTHFSEFYRPLNCWFDVRAIPSNQWLAVYLLDSTNRHQQEEHLRLLETSLTRSFWGSGDEY